MNVLLCNECAAKVRLNFPSHELAQVGSDMTRERCGHCQKQRFCTEYDMRQKKKGGD